MTPEQKIIQEFVNSFYRQKPRPGTAIVFKMKLRAAVDYCKANNLEIPAYDQAVKDYEESQKAQKALDDELADIAHGADKIGDR